MSAPSTIGGAWALLLLAAAFEVAFAVSLKYTQGFTRVTPSIITLVLAVTSLVLLTRTLDILPVGTAYAVWTGLGAVGVVTLGIIVFREPVTVGRVLSIALVLLGVIGLRVLSAAEPPRSDDSLELRSPRPIVTDLRHDESR
jgi:quaternary ammonium compound-resistance protein SugE